MEYVNIVPKSWVNHSKNYGISSGSGTWEYTHDKVYDEDTNTYHGLSIYHGGDGEATGWWESIHEWTKPKYIYKVYFYATYGTFGGNYKQWQRSIYVYLKISDSWTTIYSWNGSTPGAGSNNWYWENFEQTLTTGWDNVTGVKVYMYGRSYSYEGNRYQYTVLRLREIQVFKEKLTEVLRIKAPSGIISIGAEELKSSHKLRIRKGNITYGIPLLDIDDPEASPVRIYDGSSVKALPLGD